MRKIIVGLTLSAVFGCGGLSTTPTVPTYSSPAGAPRRQAPPPAGAYTLQVEVDENCSVPSMVEVRTYSVSLTETSSFYLLVQSSDHRYSGELWWAFGGSSASGEASFRWNGSWEGWDSCGASEMIGSTPFCLYGQGPWTGATDGTISGTLTGGVDFGERHCMNGSHRFVLRPKS